MILTLAGFMGCGKSTVGELLSRELSCRFVDLDSYLEHKVACTCAQYIDAYGIERFRAMEADALRDLFMMCGLTDESIVVALGGGTPAIFGVQHLIFGESLCVYLRTEARNLQKRIEADSTARPLYDPESMQELLCERAPVYERAHITVDTAGKTPQEETKENINVLNKWKA